jgi:hypothetical protein
VDRSLLPFYSDDALPAVQALGIASIQFIVRVKAMQSIKIFSCSRIIACVLCAFLIAVASRARAGEFVVEGGGLISPYFVLSDGNRPNAANGWDLGVIPTIRAEYWGNEDEDWKFGASILPFYFSTRQRLSNDLAVEGQRFSEGESIRLRYQFHNVRATAAYRLYAGSSDTFRVGGTLIVRYAEINVASDTRAARNTDTAAFPLVHLEYRRRLSPSLALLVRGDTLPSFSGLRQGLYDFLIGIERADKGRDGTSLSAGLRFFWGGFSPKEEGQNNNEIFFAGPVLRVSF